MGHVDGLLLFLDLLGAVDADRDDGHHVAPPCAVFSPLRCCREATPSVPGAPSFEPRLDPVKQFHVRWGWTGASFYRLALPLRGHTHPLLTEMIHELPYVPETVERVHNSDHRPPHRPLSSGEGDRSDLNKRVISHGCLQSSFLFTARRGPSPSFGGSHRTSRLRMNSCRSPWTCMLPRFITFSTARAGSARRAVAAVQVMSSGRVRPPHPSQPPEMRRDTCAEGLELRVPDPKVSASLFHEL